MKTNLGKSLQPATLSPRLEHWYDSSQDTMLYLYAPSTEVANATWHYLNLGWANVQWATWDRLSWWQRGRLL